MEALDKKLFSEVDEKGFVPDEVRNNFFRKMRMKNENRSCFECTARNPTWISLTYGVYLCLECSGEHRRKGVHLSFVRSVELDKFSPDQMVQMAVGGNGKAWEYFKSHEMGKTSGSQRPLDYTSKISLRYRQQIDKDTKAACQKFQVAVKPSQASVPPPIIVTDPIDEAHEVPPAAAHPAAAHHHSHGAAAKIAAAKAGYNAVPHTVPLAPRSPTGSAVKSPTGGAGPSITVARKSDSHPGVPSPSVVPKPTSPAAAIPKPSGFVNSKHMAKNLEFDFDFDELEKEASKPAPVPAPKAAAAPEPAPAPGITIAKTPSFDAPAAKAAPPSAPVQTVTADKFNGKKGISSADFFGEFEQESAAEQMERENRYSKLSSATAISSNSFFGDGNPEEESRGGNQHGGAEDWKARGADLARVGLSKGTELISTYLAKVRD